MQRSHIRVYVHFVWATWDRLPLITADARDRLYAVIRSAMEKHRCEVLAVGGMPDHVHVLASVPATATLAQVMHDAKGASSRWMNAVQGREEDFRWQGRYGALSVSPHDRARVVNYIHGQEEHHRAGTLWPAAEDLEESD